MSSTRPHAARYLGEMLRHGVREVSVGGGGVVGVDDVGDASGVADCIVVII